MNESAPASAPSPATSTVEYMVQDGQVALTSDGKLQKLPTAAETAAKKSLLEDEITAQSKGFATFEQEAKDIRSRLQAIFRGDVSLFDLLRQMKESERDHQAELAGSETEAIALKEVELSGTETLQEAEQRMLASLQGQLQSLEAKQDALKQLVKTALQDRQRLLNEQEKDDDLQKALEENLGGASTALAAFRKKATRPSARTTQETPTQTRLKGNRKRNEASQAVNRTIISTAITTLNAAEAMIEELFEALQKDAAALDRQLQALIDQPGGEKQQLNQQLEEQRKRLTAVQQTIDRLKNEISELRAKDEARQKRLTELAQRLQQNRGLLQKAADEWKSLEAIVLCVRTTRKDVETINEEVRKALLPYHALGLTFQGFVELQNELHATNQQFVDAIKGLYNDQFKTRLMNTMAKLKPGFMLPAEVQAGELTFEQALSSRKTKTIDVQKLIENPQEQTGAFFGNAFVELLQQASELYAQLAEQAYAALPDPEEKQVLAEVMSESEGLWNGAREAMQEAIEEHVQWFTRQLERASQEGKMNEGHKAFSAEQEAELLSALAGIDSAMVSKALFPILAIFLNPQEMQQLQQVAAGKKPVLKIDRIGHPEKTFALSQQGNQLLINQQPAHKAVLAEGDGLMAIIHDLLTSVQANEVEEHQWTFVVETA